MWDGQDIFNHLLKVDEDAGLGGKIILMHLSTERQNDFPYLILPDLIEELQNRGYVFKTISQLLTSS